MLCGCQWSRKIDAFKNYSWCIEAGCRNYFVEWKSGGWNVSFGACRFCATENPLFEDLTVKDNLELWYANDKARLQKDLEDGWLFYFGIHKIYKKPVKKLSGGMKKRLSICCALAGDPDVLVMDEPGAALDLMAKNEILRLIKNFTRKGKSVIITSHEMSEITFCHSLYGIRDGCTVTLDKEINGFELTEWIQG